MMNKDKIIKRIRKLLALSKSRNPHEAAIAMNRALALMAEYAISENDVELSGIRREMTRSNIGSAYQPPAYLAILISAIHRAFGCQSILTRSSILSASRKVEFYGFGERPLLAAYAFDVLARQMLSERREFYKSQNKRIKRSTRIARADRFCEGWAHSVWNALTAYEQSDIEREQIEKYKENLNLSDAKAREAKQCKGADESYNHGYIKGKNAKLSQGVGGTTKLIGG